MTNEQQLAALHSAVHCYLSVLTSAGDSLAEACPEVGGPFKHRIGRLRARLAFDSSQQAIEESCASVQEELREYADQSANYVARQSVELRAALVELEQAAQSLSQRQDFYGARLRQFAQQMEITAYPTDPEHLQEVVALQVAGLMSCVESMSHESQSLMARMHGELAAVETRLKSLEITDALTGLINRREMERQIDARTSAGEAPVLLHFQLRGAVGNEVIRDAAAKLAVQFRHLDLVGRWDETEFMVLFHGPVEVAQARCGQIVRWVAGSYLLAGGESVEVDVEVKLLAQPELVA